MFLSIRLPLGGYEQMIPPLEVFIGRNVMTNSNGTKKECAKFRKGNAIQANRQNGNRICQQTLYLAGP